MTPAQDFEGLFAPDPPPQAMPPEAAPWKLLLVDDEPDIRAALRLALQGVSVAGRSLRLLEARTAAEALAALQTHPDVALVLLDVVMETERAGLDLVRQIRHELGNALVQIVLVTGQPGYAPQREVVADFEINGYRLKSELTADKIYTGVCTALRTHQVMLELQTQRVQSEQQSGELHARREELTRYQTHLEQLVLERTAQLERQHDWLLQTQFALDRIGVAIAWADADTGRLRYVNDQACEQLGYTREELMALTVKDINTETDGAAVQLLADTLLEQDHSAPLVTTHRRKDGSEYPAEVTVYVHQAPGQRQYITFFSDITERRQQEAGARAQLAELTRSNQALEALNAQLRQAHGQLLQSEKMASIGLLAAGVAHEINNPVGYVKSNLNTLVKYGTELKRLLDAYDTAERQAPASTFTEVRRIKQEMDFDYLQEDVGALMSESIAGLDRVARIVQNLKDFSRLDCEEDWVEADLHLGIESTLSVIWNHLKYTCEVKKTFGDLPAIQCLPSQINQVFLNLLVNAADAIQGQGTISISTGREGEHVWVAVADTGKGIPPEQLPRIFDPFFTTKPVGKGTGLGLSLSYGIVEKHKGRIDVDSVVGQGTRFRIVLPIAQTAAVPGPLLAQPPTGSAAGSAGSI